jgi:hypothetical protein
MTITELIVCLFILYLFWAINVYDPLLEIRKEAGDERYYNKIWIGVDTENYTYHKRSSYDLKDIILPWYRLWLSFLNDLQLTLNQRVSLDLLILNSKDSSSFACIIFCNSSSLELRMDSIFFPNEFAISGMISRIAWLKSMIRFCLSITMIPSFIWSKSKARARELNRKIPLESSHILQKIAKEASIRTIS